MNETVSNVVIDLCSVSKLYGYQLAIDNVSLTLYQGEVVCLLGRNGGGKSTLINLMLGLSSPTTGKIKLRNQFYSKPLIGAALQDADYMQSLTVHELVEFVRKQYPSPLSYKDIAEIFLLDSVLQKVAKQLSFGQKKLLALALAFAGDPDIVFLDEPTIGMDSISRDHFWSIIKRFATKQRLILFTTHYLEEANALANRLLILKSGKLVCNQLVTQGNDSVSYLETTFKRFAYE
jgi:ABC-2 type transport system ATP-binding protein